MCSPCQEDMHRQAHQVTMAVEMTANGDEDKSMQKSTEGMTMTTARATKRVRTTKVTRMVTRVTKVAATMANSNEDRA